MIVLPPKLKTGPKAARQLHKKKKIKKLEPESLF